MNVGALCTRGMVSVPMSATLLEVATRMRSGHVGAVIVTSGIEPHLRVAGIITDRDIVRAQLLHTADLSRLSAGDTMTERPLVLDEQESIDGAIAQLRARMVRRAPVVTADEKPIGLVSIDDLLAQLTTTLIDVVGILGWQARGGLRDSVG
jgi:CBS domain-containing protein